LAVRHAPAVHIDPEGTMRFTKKALCAAFAAVFLLAAMSNVAAARRLQIEEFPILFIWAEMAFNAGGGVSVRCPVSLEGSFASKTISKVSGALIARIGLVQVNTAACLGGTMRARSETLPWHIQYNSFSGTLPRLTSVTQTLLGANFEAVSGGVRCEFGTT